jgi:hypothetical protein
LTGIKLLLNLFDGSLTEESGDINEEAGVN